MKKLHSVMVITILFCIFSQNILAQVSETKKSKELYLSGNILTFNNFGIRYKSQLKNGNFFRIGVTDLFANVSKSTPGESISSNYSYSSSEFTGTFEVGLEKRAQISDRLSAFYGLNFVLALGIHGTKTEDPSLPRDLRHLNSYNISPGLGFNSGFIYKISDEFSVSAEISPYVVYNYSSNERISESVKIKDITQGGSLRCNNSVKISVIYSWLSN